MRVDVVAHTAGRPAPAQQSGEGVGEVPVDLAQGLAEFRVVGQGGGVGEAEAVGAGRDAPRLAAAVAAAAARG